MTNETKKNVLEDAGFAYRLLSRMEQDCKYFLGNGNRHEKFLWSGSVKEQIADMLFIWDSLKEKPKWLSREQIKAYEKEMED